MSDNAEESADVLAKMAQYSLLHKMLTNEHQEDGTPVERTFRRQLPFKPYAGAPDVYLLPEDSAVPMSLQSALQQRRSH